MTKTKGPRPLVRCEGAIRWAAGICVYAGTHQVTLVDGTKRWMCENHYKGAKRYGSISDEKVVEVEGIQGAAANRATRRAAARLPEGAKEPALRRGSKR